MCSLSRTKWKPGRAERPRHPLLWSVDRELPPRGRFRPEPLQPERPEAPACRTRMTLRKTVLFPLLLRPTRRSNFVKSYVCFPTLLKFVRLSRVIIERDRSGRLSHLRSDRRPRRDLPSSCDLRHFPLPYSRGGQPCPAHFPDIGRGGDFSNPSVQRKGGIVGFLATLSVTHKIPKLTQTGGAFRSSRNSDAGLTPLTHR